MLDKVPSPGQAHKLQRRICCNGKMAFLCFFLTVMVLRSVPKHGTLENNVGNSESTLPYNLRGREPRRLLEEAKVQLLISKEGSESGRYSHANFDVTKIFNDEDDGFPEFERDQSQPYSLGPKISDWDQQRADWLRQNPKFPKFITAKKPRVMLVTGSSPKPCENPVGDHYLLKSIMNKMDYCRLHNIEIFYNMALLDAEMSGFWAKLPLVRKLMLSHPEVEFFWWMDSDAMFTDMAFEVPWERYKDHNLIIHGWDWRVYDEKNWFGLNMGVFLMRNCQWSLDILDAWAPMGPKGKIRNAAGTMLSRELKHRPDFEADDQAAMVYLLATEKEKWGEKVYLESAYFLHGFWLILVDKYEEMIEKHHPGLGDDRWPLVTHFVGCKPCGKFGDYSAEKCFKQMDRAFNFADNQILQMYGFTHRSLESKRVKRIRNETDNPLQVRDKYGLLHPSFRALNASSS